MISVSRKRSFKSGIMSPSISIRERDFGFWCKIAFVRSPGPGPTSTIFIDSRESSPTIFCNIFGFLRKFCQRCFLALGIIAMHRLFLSIIQQNVRYSQISSQNYPIPWKGSAFFRVMA